MTERPREACFVFDERPAYVTAYGDLWGYQKQYKRFAESFNAKKLCSEVLATEFQFYSYNGEVQFLSHPSEDLGLTYAIHH